MRATSLALLSLSASAYAFYDAAQIKARNLVQSKDDLKDSYDFVIVGGGLAGLVMASRLSEDTNTTVLVLEAGHSGDEVADQIDIPANTYYNSLGGSEYDWAYKTTPQAAAGGNVGTWPRGKTLGGSAATNGMYLVHPDSYEVDLMASVAGNDDNANRWKWDSLAEAIKKSQTFNAPSEDIANTAGIEYSADSHGDSGPIHWSYPGYEFSANADWSTTLEALGVPRNPDSASGNNLGSFVATSAINPSNWTRSYSRSGYLDTLPPRDNLQVLADAMVTKLNWDSNTDDGLKAVSVEFAADANAAKTTVNVNKEVLLAGGAIGSPQVLMHSGVGPKDILDAAGVEVKLDLPGVGQHVQDHVVSPLFFHSSESLTNAGDVHANGENSPEFMSYINSAIAYINITTILGEQGAQDTINAIKNDRDSSAGNLVPSENDKVIDGYKAIYDATLSTLEQGTGQIELLLSITSPDTVIIQAALQHSFSQGRIYITSADPFEYPTIDPQYLSHWADKYILREALKFAARIGGTAPLSDSTNGRSYPTEDDTSDDEKWDKYVETSAATEYHPTGSCAMMPEDQGGVVDTRLKVYGTSNVRVTDSSVYPIELTCHLMSPTYGLTELAADMIRREYNLGETGFGNAGSDNGNGGSNNGGSGGGNDNSSGEGGGDGALSTVPSIAAAVAMVLAAVTLSW